MVDRTPCVVQAKAGTVRDLALIDEKGYTKSLETGVLWIVHPKTGRLLPYAGSADLVSLERNQGWFLAVVDLPGEGGAAVSGTESAARGAAAEKVSGSDAAVLLRLARLVGERRRELPEGSYTTHLFTSGIEKIKKKTGEEAVELILADGRDEIVHESADLIYHLLVLLEASGVEVEELLAELESRYQR
ncbi:MAG: phosphoribosyl-ATP diphosphatase [Spirochaetia bacterium]